MNAAINNTTVGYGTKVNTSSKGYGRRQGARRWFSGYVAAAVMLLTGSGAVVAQPATGIDNAVVRINTLGAVNEEVIPYLADQAGLDDIQIPGFTLYDQTFNFNIMGFQLANVRFRMRVGNVNISLPVDSESFAAAFAGNGAANTGSVNCSVEIPDAELNTSLNLFTSCNSPLLSWLPADIRNRFNLSETFFFDVEGVEMDVSAAVTRSGSNLRVSISDFSASVDEVSIEDSLFITEVINFFGRGACQVFGQTGTCTVNQAATRLANQLLQRGDLVEDAVSDLITQAVRNQGQFGVTNPIPLPGGELAVGTVGLQTFHTRANPNRLMTEWSLGFSGSGEQFPNLEYTYLNRGTQTPANEAAAGDMQVWLPLSMFDKAMYELLQAGTFSQPVAIPAQNIRMGTQTIRVPAMSLNLVNPSVPRATKAPGTNDQVQLQFSGGLAGSAGTASANLSATIQVRVRVQTTGNDIRWQLVSADVSGLTGSITMGGVTIPSSALPPAVLASIRSSVQSAATEHSSSTRLIRRAVNLGDGWELGIGTVNIGAKYVRVPLTISHGD